MSEQKQTQNQGEGDRQAARNYNEATQNFVESEDIEEKARQAEAGDETEQAELEQAEQAAKKRAKETDPALTRDYSEATKSDDS